MIKIERKELQEELAKIGEYLGKDKTALIPILQKIQDKYGVITIEAIEEIAAFLAIKPNKVYGVATFYSFLKPEFEGKYKVRLCQTISCEMAGKEKVAQALKEELGINFGETTKDGLFSLEYTNCIGMCDEGPAVLINEKVYTKLTPEKIKEIISKYRSESASFKNN